MYDASDRAPEEVGFAWTWSEEATHVFRRGNLRFTIYVGGGLAWARFRDDDFLQSSVTGRVSRLGRALLLDPEIIWLRNGGNYSRSNRSRGRNGFLAYWDPFHPLGMKPADSRRKDQNEGPRESYLLQISDDAEGR